MGVLSYFLKVFFSLGPHYQLQTLEKIHRKDFDKRMNRRILLKIPLNDSDYNTNQIIRKSTKLESSYMRAQALKLGKHTMFKFVFQRGRERFCAELQAVVKMKIGIDDIEHL